jgi:hypothetical protein
MHLKPVFTPQTQLDLSLAVCFLDGAGIRYVVHNRNTFSTFAFPPVPAYTDCGIFVSADDYEDASAILSDLQRPGDAVAPLRYKLRLIFETWFFGRFVQVRHSIATTDATETET